MQTRTQVCITVDTEFSIAGHFEDPQRYAPLAEPVVYGHVNGKQQGLGFLLDTLNQYQIKASFFVECANYFYFGDEPMSTVVRQIQAAQQDIQLHIHPVWLSFGNKDHPNPFPRHDDCSGRNYAEIFRVIETCSEVFERWVGHRPDALRTGSLRVDSNVYRAMASLGIPLASNIALGVYTPKETELQILSGRKQIHGVMELPVFTYQDSALLGYTHNKSLQITSCSWPELRHLLWAARKAGVEQIVLLTHPFEFIKKSDFRYSRVTRNRINQTRLQKLCHFINQHDQDFEAANFSDSRQQWLASERQHPSLRIPSIFAVGRKIHNKINDLVWAY
ncbi:MAG: polysaccharide deacetylase family protein [Motiliproteus sp.]